MSKDGPESIHNISVGTWKIGK